MNGYLEKRQPCWIRCGRHFAMEYADCLCLPKLAQQFKSIIWIATFWRQVKLIHCTYINIYKTWNKTEMMLCPSVNRKAAVDSPQLWFSNCINCLAEVLLSSHRQSGFCSRSCFVVSIDLPHAYSEWGKM